MTQLDAGPPAVADSARAYLRRSIDNRMLGGVCGGLGQYFNTDPVWFRLAFVLVTLAGGAGILIYLIAWLVIPPAEPGDPQTGNPADIGTQGPMMVGIALVGIGLMLLVNTLVPWFDRVIWPFAVITAGSGLLYLGSRHEHD
jgi:phage shock protein C